MKIIITTLVSIITFTGVYAAEGIRSIEEYSYSVTKSNFFKWEILGSRKVNFMADHDEIYVTALEGTFKALKMKVEKAGIHLKNVNIIFGNGQNMNIPINKFVKAGTFSPTLDLPGNKRVIKKVNFNYITNPNASKKAKVILFGRH